MIRAVWNGAVIAEAPRTVRVEGNHYFPPESLRREHLIDSPSTSLCPWKGLAHYYTVAVDGHVNPDAAWYYPRPSPLARRIRNHVAFWKGVTVEGEREGESQGVAHRVAAWRRGSIVTREVSAMSGVEAKTTRSHHGVSSSRLPVWRIGLTSGLVGMLCCVGPTVLALFGIISATTALAWANDLYGDYAWWFRLGGLGALVLLAWIALRRRNQCSLGAIRRLKWRLATVLVIAVGTYGVLYAVTTWLETFA